MSKEPAFYLGVVEDRSDPLMLGRVRVRILGLHTHDKALLPTEDLPWAYKIQQTTSGAISGIGHAPVGVMEGTWVAVQFIDPDKQMPFVVGTLGGIPQGKIPPLESFQLLNEQSNVVTSSDGTPVTSSDGTPVTTGSATEPTAEPPKTEEPQTTTSPGNCCSTVNASQMQSQFGSNVGVLCKALCDGGIKDPYAIIAILSNVAKESKFKLVRESLVYSSVARIRAVFPGSTKNKTDAELQGYVRNEEAFANFIYANKIGNGPESSGDGWKYRGGGFIQLTGKANYREYSAALGVDLVSNPDLVNSPEVAAKIVVAYIKKRVKTLSFSDLDSACRAITKAINPGGLSMDLPKVQNYSKLCYIVGEQTPAQKAQAEESVQTTQPEQKEQRWWIEDSGAPKSSTGQQTSSSSQPVGFRDPNAKYPLADHLNEPDTNRLARNQKIGNTSVALKERLRHTAVPQANGTGTWSQSPVPYNAKYPFNNVWQSESGHVLEFDDTAGRERINLYHRKGTFTEIDHNGTQVNFIVGDGYQIYERNGFVHVSGALNVTVDGAHTLRVEGTSDVEIHGETNINIHSNATLNVAGNMNVTAGGNMFLKAGGTFAVDAAAIHLNSGLAAGLRTVSRKEASSVNFSDLSVLVRAEEVAVDYEVTDEDDAAVVAYQNKMISEGLATKEELTEKPAIQDEAKPEPNLVPEKASECGVPAAQKEFTGTEMLSKYYKLGDLNNNNTRKLKAISGITEASIFCNLKALSINCLDVLKARYPNMVINSGYRNFVPPGGSKTSQHLTGQAVDVSFPGLSRSELYDRVLEVQKLIPYDQLILEYASGPGWIHISFNTNGNRRQHFTMNHHRRVSPIGTFVKVA